MSIEDHSPLTDEECETLEKFNWDPGLVLRALRKELGHRCTCCGNSSVPMVCDNAVACMKRMP